MSTPGIVQHHPSLFSPLTTVQVINVCSVVLEDQDVSNKSDQDVLKVCDATH